MWLPERAAFGRLRSRLLAPLRGDVLEIGAGTGLNFTHYSAAARVLALEPDPAMRARAMSRLRPNISLRPADDEFLETLPPASFDAVVCSFVLCSVPDIARTLRRVARVLRSGGTLAVLEHVRSPGELGKAQDALTPLWRRAAGNCHLNRETTRTIEAGGFIPQSAGISHIPGIIVRDVVAGLYRTPSSGQNP